ncbi:hypothetical protein BGW80DRAFT_1252182 [Lactifluus volemus]|nr:hypothetical protein BGW80DRAFT_1252182 [Lactifluus volemus]
MDGNFKFTCYNQGSTLSLEIGYRNYNAIDCQSVIRLTIEMFPQARSMSTLSAFLVFICLPDPPLAFGTGNANVVGSNLACRGDGGTPDGSSTLLVMRMSPKISHRRRLCLAPKTFASTFRAVKTVLNAPRMQSRSSPSKSMDENGPTTYAKLISEYKIGQPLRVPVESWMKDAQPVLFTLPLSSRITESEE